MWVTSTPCRASPAAKASDSSGLLGRMSWPIATPSMPSGSTTVWAKASPRARATRGFNWSGTRPRTS